MFRVLIEETIGDEVTKRVDINRIKTEKLYEMLGRYFQNFLDIKRTYTNEGIFEVEYTGVTENNKPIVVTIGYWRVSKEDSKPKETTKSSNVHVLRAKEQTPAKPEEPKDPRIQAMYDAGVIQKSSY